MNPRSDVDFTSPKVDLVVNLPEVAVELSRPQVCKHEVLHSLNPEIVKKSGLLS